MSTALQQLAAWCSNQPVRLCVLFGSRARGSAMATSDYDLAIRLTDQIAPLERLVWQNAIETLLNTDVSLVFLSEQTDPVLGWEIARDGRLIYEAQPEIWANERARLWHLYNDALPFRRGLAESLRRYAEDIRHAS